MDRCDDAVGLRYMGHSAVTYEIGVPTGFPVKLAIIKIGKKCTVFVRVKTTVVAL